MFERDHHNRILKILRSFDADALADAHCFFGGGTAIVLKLGEYRESVDIDFLCSDVEGYRRLRSAVNVPVSLGRLMRTPIEYARDVRTERDKIFARAVIDDIRIKIEFVLEARISIDGRMDDELGVPILNRADMYAEKLLANADRCLDTAVLSRDAIDLAMMINHWGCIPQEAWDKATAAYGEEIPKRLMQAQGLLSDDAYFQKCLRSMSMAGALAKPIRDALSGEIERWREEPRAQLTP